MSENQLLNITQLNNRGETCTVVKVNEHPDGHIGIHDGCDSVEIPAEHRPAVALVIAGPGWELVRKPSETSEKEVGDGECS